MGSRGYVSETLVPRQVKFSCGRKNFGLDSILERMRVQARETHRCGDGVRGQDSINPRIFPRTPTVQLASTRMSRR
jgi:hypothetical protein